MYSIAIDLTDHLLFQPRSSANPLPTALVTCAVSTAGSSNSSLREQVWMEQQTKFQNKNMLHGENTKNASNIFGCITTVLSEKKWSNNFIRSARWRKQKLLVCSPLPKWSETTKRIKRRRNQWKEEDASRVQPQTRSYKCNWHIIYSNSNYVKLNAVGLGIETHPTCVSSTKDIKKALTETWRS